MSVLGSGVIAEGLASLRQCISIILRTSLGSDPMRPHFGSEIYKYADAPGPSAIPNVKASIVTALAQWEKRINVINVSHALLDLGHIEYSITYTIVDSDISDTIIFDITNGFTATASTSALTLQAFFPPGIDTKRNNISLSLNHADVLPTPPINGFANLAETLAWVTTNWGNFGKWYLLADKLVCYLTSTDITQASLSLSVTTDFRVATLIPVLNPNRHYQVSFNPNNTGFVNSEIFNTKGDMLVWLRANWANSGSWVIENGITYAGEFNTDFGNDFNISSTPYMLVLYTNTSTAEVIVTTVG